MLLFWTCFWTFCRISVHLSIICVYSPFCCVDIRLSFFGANVTWWPVRSDGLKWINRNEKLLKIPRNFNKKENIVWIQNQRIWWNVSNCLLIRNFCKHRLCHHHSIFQFLEHFLLSIIRSVRWFFAGFESLVQLHHWIRCDH